MNNPAHSKAVLNGSGNANRPELSRAEPIVGDVQKFSVSFAKLDHGLCRMSPYFRLVSCCVLWGMCRSSVCLLPNWTMFCVSYVPILTAGVMLCIVGEVQKFTGLWFVYYMSPYLPLGSCCVLWGMCRSSVCLLPNWTMFCVSYVPILTAGVMLCIVGEVQKFTGLWFVYYMSPYLPLGSCCVLWGMCRSSVCLLPNWTMVWVSYVPILSSGVMLCIVGDVQKFIVSFAKLDHGLCVVCPHTFGWCHVVYCGGCAEVQCVFCQNGPWFVCRMSPYFRLVSCCVLWGMCRSSVCLLPNWTMVCVSYVPIIMAGVMLCIVGDVQKFTGPWFVCRMSPYFRLVSCCVLWGKCRSSVCLLPNWTMFCVSYVPILTAGVMLCIVGEVQKFTGPWFVYHMSPYLRLVSCCVL